MAHPKKGARELAAARKAFDERVPWRLGVQPEFLEDLRWWSETEPRNLTKALKLMDECARDPRAGTGKPEQLRHHGADAHIWSRRITGEHRLVYRVDDG